MNVAYFQSHKSIKSIPTHEIEAESKINLWMDIRVIGIGGILKPDILIEHSQSMVSLKVTIMIEMDWEQTNVEW